MSLIDKSNVYLLSYAFNQDYSCFLCGTTRGFRVYTLNPIAEVHRREDSSSTASGACSCVAMLFKTNIFPLVRLKNPFSNNSSGGPASGGLGAGSGVDINNQMLMSNQHHDTLQSNLENSNKVQIWDDNRSAIVGELSNRHEVRGVVLRRDVIVMVCEYSIYMYTTDVLRLILHIATCSNLKGLCALSPREKTWTLCCPGQTAGTIRVQYGQVENQQLVVNSSSNTVGTNNNSNAAATAAADKLSVNSDSNKDSTNISDPNHINNPDADTGGSISGTNSGGAEPGISHVFTAHQSALAALAVNQTGSLIASASEQGTVVRVFSARHGQVLHELRRGSTPCIISCLTFRGDDRYLAVGSNLPTVHIFRLEQPDHGGRMQSSQTGNSLIDGASEKMANMYANFLPKSNLSEYVSENLPESVQNVTKNLPESVQNIASAIQSKIDKVNFREQSEKILHDAAATAAAALPPSVPRYFLATRSYALFRVPDVPGGGPEGGISGSSVSERVLSDTVFNTTGINPSSASAASAALLSGVANDHHHTLGDPSYHHHNSYNHHSQELWDRERFPDFRASGSQIRGPLVCFGPPASNTFYILHYNGFLYEVKMSVENNEKINSCSSEMLSNRDPTSPTSGPSGASGGGGIKETSSRTHLVAAHTWFSSRQDFQMHRQTLQEEEGEWQLI